MFESTKNTQISMINYLQNTGKADEISFGLIETDRNTQKMKESYLVLKNDN